MIVAQVEPRSLRNNYYGGLTAWYNKDYKKAIHYWTIATTTAESLAPTEKDVREFFLSESRRGLLAAQEK